MKRVGILTIIGGTNYGNKLQNFALQSFLTKNGYESETIQYRVSYSKQYEKFKDRIQNIFFKYYSTNTVESIYNTAILLGKYLHRTEISRKERIREEKFKRFIDDHIIISKTIYKSRQQLRDTDSVYDKVIVGSDQVWNPYWQGKEDEFFLDFISAEKRIAYAPSIGVSKIPEDQVERYKKLLTGFDSLSCREKEGAELIRSISGKDCLNVVDPVFLLDPFEWMSLADGKHEGGYIVTYFLAGMSSKTQKMVQSYARKNNLDIIDVYSPESFRSSFAGIEEFISLIANADMVFTDSFHGIALSIIMKRQFVVCDRRFQRNEEKMNSRIDGLLERLEIKGRYAWNGWEQQIINYEEVAQKLLPWIQNSKAFLVAQLERQ